MPVNAAPIRLPEVVRKVPTSCNVGHTATPPVESVKFGPPWQVTQLWLSKMCDDN